MGGIKEVHSRCTRSPDLNAAASPCASAHLDGLSGAAPGEHTSQRRLYFRGERIRQTI